jgi:hypothetical protein
MKRRKEAPAIRARACAETDIIVGVYRSLSTLRILLSLQAFSPGEEEA